MFKRTKRAIESLVAVIKSKLGIDKPVTVLLASSNNHVLFNTSYFLNGLIGDGYKFDYAKWGIERSLLNNNQLSGIIQSLIDLKQEVLSVLYADKKTNFFFNDVISYANNVMNDKKLPIQFVSNAHGINVFYNNDSYIKTILNNSDAWLFNNDSLHSPYVYIFHGRSIVGQFSVTKLINNCAVGIITDFKSNMPTLGIGREILGLAEAILRDRGNSIALVSGVVEYVESFLLKNGYHPIHQGHTLNPNSDNVICTYTKELFPVTNLEWDYENSFHRQYVE